MDAPPVEVKTEPAPPFLGRWSRIYALVLGELVLLVVLFAMLTVWAS